ncbi:uncharacterized protein MONOS_6432 [Monocercomonoides exilis]|uniref:uncharacterized protein n=1 Tax=Monocercomonoides exilis TaxID=2049356 RepID=UPI00355A8745|nr:hypothetical protein MONOS_6432 [Monocercomonoides exilis]|eukprot:MONOS_6432.1-p1 / transcript=MONOS_6432.1 / gene=MONOS_6432 / organism=Monocercomonoides_exilis_PA203 / gene_product=ORF3 / transcript_product=ORF3 / location=Mono_scaffold00202:52167-54737(-) / protein_length=769 / sequence_SO=supercontig / SO=protein_coding / is_pseudo=false
MYLQEWDKINGGRLIRLGTHACWKGKRAKERLEKRAWVDGAKRMSEEQRRAFRSVQKEQLDSGIISISSVNQDKFRNNIFLVKKKSGAWHQILDYRPLNAAMKRLHFKCESERTVEHLIQKDDYAIILDLAQAYYLIRVSPDLKQYLSFRFEGTDYSFEGMPFGFIRSVFGINQEPSDIVFGKLVINIYHKDKCQLKPTRRFTYLGFDWDTEEFTARLVKDRAFSFVALLNLWEKKSIRAKQVRMKDFASLIGKKNAVRFIRQDASLRMVALHHLLQKNVKTSGWSWRMKMNASVLKELREWKWILNLNKPRQLQTVFSAQATLTTDASELAMGATLRINNRILDWNAKLHKYARSKSSNHREQLAMLLAHHDFSQIIRTNKISQLQLRSDNSSVVFNINRWNVGKNLRSVLRKIWKWKEATKVQMKAQHLSGTRNNRAYAISRIERAKDYTIKERTFKKVISLTKVKPTLDAFAAHHNHMLDRWYGVGSPMHKDMLSVPWSQECVLAHPPIPLIPMVIRKAHRKELKLFFFCRTGEARTGKFFCTTATSTERKISEELGEQCRQGVAQSTWDGYLFGFARFAEQWKLCGHSVIPDNLPEWTAKCADVFLSLKNKEVKVSVLQMIRAAVSFFSSLAFNTALGEIPIIKTLFRSLRRTDTARKKTVPEIWNPKTLLKYYNELGPNIDLTFKALTQKVITLTMLFSACRFTELERVDMSQSRITKDGVYLDTSLKTSNTRTEIAVPFLSEVPFICPASAIRTLWEIVQTKN